EKTKGDVDLKRLANDPKLATEFTLWQDVKDTVSDGDMPPKKAHQLSEEEHKLLLGWVTESLNALANAKAGDPGPVTMRRLTNAEYDYTIRDLTGRDYGLAKEFQTDGGGGEGFANTGDVLFVSPQALDKYFSAARKVADFATILPGTGIVFNEQRIGLRGTEQMRAQAEQALYVWYQHKAEAHLPKDGEDLREADYMLACWKYQHKDLTGEASLDKLAKNAGLSLAFLQNWWNLLSGTEPKSRFLDLTRQPWRDLPAPDAKAPKVVPASIGPILQAVQDQRRIWVTTHIQRQQQDADGLRPYPVRTTLDGQAEVYLCIGDGGDGNKGDIALVSDLTVKMKDGKSMLYFDALQLLLKADREALAKLKAPPSPSPAAPAVAAAKPKGPTPPAPLSEAQLTKRIAEVTAMLAKFGKHPLHTPVDAKVLALAAPQVVVMPLPSGVKMVSGSCRLDLNAPDAEFATIQWRLANDNPPDVTKIMPGILTVWKISTQTARETMHDFEKMRKVFPDEYVRRLEEVARNYYSNKPGIGVYYYSDEQLAALINDKEKKELESMKKDWGYVGPGAGLPAKYALEYDKLLQGHLHKFATQAWRRPLTTEESAKLDALYADGRSKEMDRESAAREVMVRVLVSPNFLFKAETLPVAAVTAPSSIPAGPNTSGPDHALSAWELASRLSYFLWASMPDDTLRQAASDGSLLKPEVLATQTQRMLRDPKGVALAHEFAGQWLGFNNFNTQNTVDEKKFPEFFPEVRNDMQTEAEMFFSHLVSDDRNVCDIVDGDYTFLNARLATYYGIAGVQGDDFREVKVVSNHRGGVLGMGCILTKTSRPNRTSPVLRGDFLYKVVLGNSSPPPPPNVPKLPEGAVKPSTLREAMQQHRADKACAVCHDRLDPLGFALEDFDPVGKFRTQDEGGGKIDNTGEMKDGTKLNGADGLRAFLKSHESQFVSQFCRKLLGYATGRQTMPTDKALLAQMQDALKKNGNKLSSALLAVVNSHQFLYRRTDSAVVSNP
ncbi:MAG: hypothetical protein JWO94_2708, partial [Verrucomicrobiaceae bacterium]|nr:hypothetical protein [Verrucomicrobiaceae bacterium]